MQYGNGLLTKNPALTAIGFKSYYVVWKLLMKLQQRTTDASLNRTMQYGNPATNYPEKKENEV